MKPSLPAAAGRAVQRQHFAAQALGLFGRELHRLGGPRRLEHAFGQRLAFFQADQPAQLLLPGEHHVGRLAENLKPLVARQLPHDRRALHGRRDGRFDVGRGRLRHRIDDDAVERIADFDLGDRDRATGRRRRCA